MPKKRAAADLTASVHSARSAGPKRPVGTTTEMVAATAPTWSRTGAPTAQVPR